MSVLAGILDTYGGLRFVVAEPKQLKYHVRHDEVCVVVPDVIAPEAVPWGAIPWVISRIEQEVKKWIAERRYGNEPHVIEAVTMYQLRCLEHPGLLTKRSLDLGAIVET